MPARIAILLSGSGSNAQAFIEASQRGDLAAEIVLVLSNKASAFGLKRAKKAGILTNIVDHRDFQDRESFDRVLVDRLQAVRPDLVILAGFMRILTPTFIDAFAGKLLNIHPSLLPKYRGLNTHQRAIDARDEHAGASVHFVTAELDGGPVILQAKVAIEVGESADQLAAKILQLEHKIYPLAAQWFLQDRLTMTSEGVMLDQQLLPETGVCFDPTETNPNH